MAARSWVCPVAGYRQPGQAFQPPRRARTAAWTDRFQPYCATAGCRILGDPGRTGVKQLSGWHDHAVLVNTSEDEYNKEKNRLKPLREWKRDTLIPQSPVSVDAGQAPLTEALSSTPAPQRSTKSKPERIFPRA